MKRISTEAELEEMGAEMTQRFCDEVRALKRSGWSVVVRRAADYIRVNLSKPMTTAEIARAAGVDRHRLTESFGRETGQTIKQYVAARRCEVAAELLQYHEISVQAAAAYVGYTDTNYFAKVFKANQGVSPQAYQIAHKML